MKNYLRRLIAGVCTCALLLTAASALTVEQAVELLEENYVDDLPANVYEAETLDEVFEALGDSYTYYMNAEDYAAFNAYVEDTSSLVGVGIAIQYSDRGLDIVQVVNGGPAEAAGLKAGDVVIAVDGISSVPGTVESVDRIAGEEGTQVTLTILHADGTVEDYVIVRAFVVVNNTNISIRDHIGVIECTSFGSETAGLIRTGIGTYEDVVDSWWMDLRDNPGGLADAAVEAVGMFAGGGIHLYYRSGAGEYYIGYTNEPYLTIHPVITLMNGNSASASEVFASGIRDTMTGIAIGGRSFGKGVAQVILNAENTKGYFTDDAMKVTTYRIFSSLGNTTDRIGVIPTLLVDSELADEVASLLCATAPEDSEGWLKIGLAGWAWYIDLEEAGNEANANAFKALLEALTPDAMVYIGAGGDVWARIPAELLLARYGTNVQSRWFTDVQGSDYSDQLNILATYDILRGSGDGTFNPKGTLTRAELSALLAQTLNVKSTSESAFEDVPDGSWYAPYVMAMSQLGLMKGYGNGNFGPHDPVTNEDMITVVGRLAAFLNIRLRSTLEGFTEEELADERLSDYRSWAKESARLMIYLEELSEDGESMVFYDELVGIDPSAHILREQAGATICNLLNVTGVLVY